MRKLTLEQSFELESLLLKERDRSIQKGFADLDKILGYYLIGLNGYVEGGYYPENSINKSGISVCVCSVSFVRP